MQNLKLLLENLEQVIPKDMSLNQAIMKVLKVNKDAASRRINGKASFTLDEICALSKAYGVDLLPAQSTKYANVVFGYAPSKSKMVESKHFFQNISELLNRINSHKHKLLYHIAPEVPLFHYYNHPQLLKFKLFYWGKYLLNDPFYIRRTFKQTELDPAIITASKKAYQQYCMIPSVEIWTPQTIQSVLTQLHFCLDTGDFAKKNEIDLVLADLEQMVERIRQMAEENNKAFDLEKKMQVPFQFYKMHVNINSTSILAEMDEQKIALLPLNSINFMNTSQQDFCRESLSWIQNIQSKSSLLSGAGIVERQRYFSSVNRQIIEFRNTVEKYDL